MQSPQRTDIPSRESELLKLLKRKQLPLGIEDFISQKESPVTKNVFKLKSPIRYAQEDDVYQIISVNYNVYNGYYPYKDMLDVEYVSKFAKNRESGFIGIYDTEDGSTIGGFMLIGIDEKERKGYLRGLMVRPEHRNKLHLKNRFIETVYQGYKQYSTKTELWFGETRTEHSIGQLWMEETGSRPCAFLPNKDIFNGDSVRESDVLEVAYTQDRLHKLRNFHPEILPAFQPLYNHISKYYNLPNGNMKSSSFSLTLPFVAKATEIANRCFIEKIPQKYNTHLVQIQTPAGSKLSFILNDSIASGEHTMFELIPSNSQMELATLLLALKDVFQREKLEYFEMYLPATNTDHQQLIMDLGFSVYGYIPSWKKEKGNNHDCFIFGLYHSPIDWSNTQLTTNAHLFVNVLKPYLRKF